jgi:hypothetical protein
MEEFWKLLSDLVIFLYICNLKLFNLYGTVLYWLESLRVFIKLYKFSFENILFLSKFPASAKVIFATLLA